jgi:MoaA/NifB/PqqE/SkfB family radical SAM enzyme
MLLDQSFHIHHNFASFYERFKKLIIRSYIYATIVLQRNFKLDKGYGTVREGVNSLLSVIGALSLIISIVTHYAFLLFLTSIVTQLLVDARLYTYINNKKGIIFSIRAIPVIYAWYLAMGIGATMAVLTYYGQKIFAYLKMFNFLFSKTPPYLIFLVTSRCDARCKHCFNWERVQNPRLSKELTFDEIEKISVNFGSIKYMTYGGGEPSLREDIADITQLFYNNNNLERLNFITNGFATNALVDEVKRILRLCPGLRLTVSFSIDGIESQHDEIRGMPGGFKRLLRTINEIKRLQRYYPKLKILATTVYSNFNMDNIFEVINYITKTLKLEMVLSYIRGEPLDKNAKKVELETYVKATEMVMRLNAENSKKTDIIRAIDNLCFKLIAETKKRGKRILQCVAGKRLIEITSDGTILPCEMIGIDFGNIRDYNYDIKKALKTDRFSDFFKFLKRKDCYCIWECAMKNNIVYSVSQYPSLFFEWFGQRAR